MVILNHRRPFIMAKREKKPVHHVQMTDGKRAIIQQLLQEYDIESAQDIQDALKDLLGGTIKEMMEAEMDEHLGYGKSERADRSEINDYRNGTKQKQVNSSYGPMTIDVPQDRNSTFVPQVVRKRQKDISDIDQKIISMYAKGMTTSQISDTLMDIYGFEVSEGFISDVTDKLLPQIEEWQNRPLDEIYPVLFIDAIHYSVRDNGVIRKLAAYVILGINLEGRKEVLTIEVGQNESAKYWLSVLNGLKNRGVKDILIICADGLTGIKEAINAAFPKTEYQRCIVHQVRNTLKYVADKDKKQFAADLKKIYNAPKAEQAETIRDQVIEKWSDKYPNAMKSWVTNWDAITPIYKFSSDVRTIIYTTNAIESLNSTYRRLNRQRSVFPSDQALLKALYLATFEATKKWTMPIRNWGKVYGELSIMYEDRLPE
jgi:transposase-like protein